MTDFDLIVRRFEKNEDIHIYPIADVHLGAQECLEREWKQFCEDILKDPNAYVVLVGDLINNSTRHSIGAGVYTDIYSPREQKKRMADALTPLKDRILACVAGNHERRSAKEVDDDAMADILCLCKLDLEDVYRENMAFLKLQFGEAGHNRDGKVNPTYVLAVTHGAGGGMLTGGSVNRFERFSYILSGIDALIAGHNHKPFVTQPARLVVDPFNNKVKVVPFKVLSCSSWLEYGGYAMQKMLLPSSHALQMMTLRGNKKEIKVEM